MTRYARAGNSQRHKKMPQDPTPWGDFSNQSNVIAKTEKKFKANKVMKAKLGAASTSLKKKIKRKLNKTKFKKVRDETSPLLENADNKLEAGDDNLGYSLLRPKYLYSKTDSSEKNWNRNSDEKNLNKNSYEKNSNKNESSDEKDSNENENSDEKHLPHGSKLVHISQNKNKVDRVQKKELEEEFTSDKESPLIQRSESDDVTEDAGTLESSPSRIKNGPNPKKNKFLDRVQANRIEKGMILLPKNIEGSIYRMKKVLREKGFPGEQIKEIVRKRRRKEENKYRKNMKTCFNCRQFGHLFSECPKAALDNEQGTGICFKCGSTEHTSFKCPLKTSEFAYAKCFICQKVGHLSRSCPENERGIYPKGGSCNLCGSVHHLRAHCPKSAIKKDGENSTFTAHLINDFTSVDEEIIEMEPKPIKHKKGPKHVKF